MIFANGFWSTLKQSGRLVGGGPVANRLEPDSFGGPVEELRDRILSRRD
jgi:hypothetical protein